VHDFGFALTPEEVLKAQPRNISEEELKRRTREMERRLHGGIDDLAPKIGKEGFQVCVDVHQFAPSEISVKASDDFIVVECSHEERQDDHGFISRRFHRRYPFFQGCDSNKITSELSSDGVLTIKAPLKVVAGPERSVPIKKTGDTVQSNAKESEAKEDQKEIEPKA
jgi:HSP20 family molecular chaperone IbpA